MKYKMLFISLIIIFFTCSCEKDDLKDIVVKEKEQINIIPEEIITENVPNEESINQSLKPIESKPVIEEKEIYKTEVTVEETSSANDNSVDESSIDYPIHKGKIDCETESSCIEKSLPIQFKYHDVISNVFYLEVLSKSNQVLGYFIEYVLIDYQYETEEACQTIGTNIKNDLNDKIISYECTEDNILKLATSY